MCTEIEEFLTPRDFEMARLDVPNEEILAKMNRPLVEEEPQRNNLEHLLGEEKPIFYTENGNPVYPQDDVGEYYQRHSVSRENNPLFLRQEQDRYRSALDSIFTQLTKELKIMIDENDERDIYYFPKGSYLSVQSSRQRANKSFVTFYAYNNERFFVRKAKEEESKSGYEVLPGFGREYFFDKKENFGAPTRIVRSIDEERMVKRATGWKEGKTYFNLSKAEVLNDFNKFCDFIMESDKSSVSLRKR